MENTDKTIQRLNKEEFYNKIPFYTQKGFLWACVGILVIYPFLFLPKIFTKAEGLQLVSVFVYIIVAAVLVFSILVDYRKPVALKRLCSFGLIILILVLFTFYSGAKWALIKKRFLNFNSLKGIWPQYWDGLLMSLKLTIVTAVFAVLLGALLGILRSLHNSVLNNIIILYVDIFRSIPLIALMLFVFYGVPFMGVNLSPFFSACIALILLYSAYIAEIVRAGVESVHKIQLEAASTLGLSTFQTIRYIVLPQALRVIIPPLTSSVVGIIKDTSVA